MTPAEIRRLTRKWQRILRLRDWEITVRFVDRDDLANERNIGECEVATHAKSAEILIARDDDEPEATLVHELLHVYFDPWYVDDSADPMQALQEQFIEVLAQVLVSYGGESDAE